MFPLGFREALFLINCKKVVVVEWVYNNLTIPISRQTQAPVLPGPTPFSGRQPSLPKPIRFVPSSTHFKTSWSVCARATAPYRTSWSASETSRDSRPSSPLHKGHLWNLPKLFTTINDHPHPHFSCHRQDSQSHPKNSDRWTTKRKRISAQGQVMPANTISAWMKSLSTVSSMYSFRLQVRVEEKLKLWKTTT